MNNNSNIAIKVDNIAKRYRIGVKENSSEHFAGALIDLIKSPLKNFKKYRALYKFDDDHADPNAYGNKDHPDILWALKDITFDLKRGEVLGVIGRNGAGKSTLLKILSRITYPTRGNAQINGRVSTLLEVGTGFHPELTGRENVYLNGTILGMTKSEIDHKYDEIVDFSGVEKFIDTPVKRYSSGMTVRLAFSVAAHLSAEIIIVDEVLAVGDSDFQKKCIAKMEDAGQLGRTVLIVSHNMASITRLCSRAILIEDGFIKVDGPADEVVKEYLTGDTGTTSEKVWNSIAEAPGKDISALMAVRVMDENGQVRESFDIRQPIFLEMVYEVMREGFVLLPHFSLTTETGIIVFQTLENDPQWRGKKRARGNYVSRVEIPGNFLSEGILYVSCNLITMYPNILQFSEKQTIAFQVVDSHESDSARGDWHGNLSGVIRPLLDWETRYNLN
jgi:lipopolysaccharide transport system ATP-binding protein